MKTHIFMLPLLLLALVAAPASNGMQTEAVVDSKAAFASLKTLVGEWQSESDKGKARLEYEIVAGGSTLLERETIEGMPPMLTLYHLDGGRLLLTHHCALGNQPRMQARAFNREAGELKFEFLDITNLGGGNASHMHDARIRFVDGNHFVSEWDFYENGRLKYTETFKYARTR